ncbi:hypothetical protein [Sphingomonas aerolata]|jgi:hypothetical protein|nr:hypothetical protein [Sphingomonas aerolata]
MLPNPANLRLYDAIAAPVARVCKRGDTFAMKEMGMTTEPMRARAVFSTADFELLKEAIGELITKVSVDDVKLSRLSALYHRLGRLG